MFGLCQFPQSRERSLVVALRQKGYGTVRKQGDIMGVESDHTVPAYLHTLSRDGVLYCTLGGQRGLGGLMPPPNKHKT